MQGWGQLAAEVFWPSRSDRPGRAWVRVVRELELFLLTLRSQRSSGQLSPLPEPLLSSPGEKRRLQQARPTVDPKHQGDPEPSTPPWGPPMLGNASSTLSIAPGPPGPAKA